MATPSNHASWTDLLYINDFELVQKMVWQFHRTTFKNYKTLHDHMGLKIPVVLANLYKLVYNKYLGSSREEIWEVMFVYLIKFLYVTPTSRPHMGDIKLNFNFFCLFARLSLKWQFLCWRILSLSHTVNIF